ncbi:MAG: pilus assembly protein [Pseudomonadota bacterium]
MNATLIRMSAVALLASVAGCASTTPNLDQQFGVAAKVAVQQQTLHPGAPASQSVAGMDGSAAKSAYDNYQKSFKDPVPQTGALSIGVGR